MIEAADAPSAERMKPAPARRRVWLAAGGTGGHIYPALELGRALAEASPHIEITYCCGNRPGELEIYRGRGVNPHVLPIPGRRGGAVGTAKFAADLSRAYLQVAPAMKRDRPDLVVGFGGYPSVPALAAARRLGVPTMIHEQNALPGVANRWLARRAQQVFTGTKVREGAFPAAKVLETGNPVRREIREAPGQTEARAELGLPTEGRVCLVFGGSLGARGVNRLARELLERTAQGGGAESAADETQQPSRSEFAIGDWFFLWSTGPTQHDEVAGWLADRPQLADRVRIEPYLHRMELAYAAADAVICRAGALTLAELTVLGKPSALVPLPTSAGGHQLENARVLERAKAAVVVEESDPAAVEKVGRWLRQCAADSAKLKQMSEAARGLARPDAARVMTQEILRFLGLR